MWTSYAPNCAPGCRPTRCRAASSYSRPTSCPCCRAASPTCMPSRSCSLPSERLTVPALVRRWADEQPDKAFVVTDDDELTYGELEQRSAVMAQHFADLGVGKGTRV